MKVLRYRRDNPARGRERHLLLREKRNAWSRKLEWQVNKAGARSEIASEANVTLKMLFLATHQIEASALVPAVIFALAVAKVVMLLDKTFKLLPPI